MSSSSGNEVPTPAEVLEELEQHDELVVELYARDIDGLPATVRRMIQDAIDRLPYR